MKKNKYFLISLLIIFIVIAFNVYVRSVKVFSVSTDGDQQIMTLEYKYFEYFEIINIISIVLFTLVLLTNIVFLLYEKRLLIARLQLINESFHDVGFNKIDVSSKKFTETDLVVINAWNNSINEISELTKKRESYFSYMVHDFKKPIYMLKANLELFEEGDDINGLLQDLNSEVSDLEYEITKYLHVEKISYFEKPDLQEINLINFLTSVTDQYKIIDFNITLTFDNQKMMINTDKKMLEHIVSNLCQNAFTYSEDKKLDIHISEKSIILMNKTNTKLDYDIYNTNKRAASTHGNGLGSQIISKYIELLEWNIESNVTKNVFTTVIEMK